MSQNGICCKIFKVCLTILGHYVFKGEDVLQGLEYDYTYENS